MACEGARPSIESHFLLRNRYESRINRQEQTELVPLSYYAILFTENPTGNYAAYIPEQVDACSTDVYCCRGFLSAPVIVRAKSRVCKFATGGMGSQHHYVLPTDMSPEAL